MAHRARVLRVGLAVTCVGVALTGIALAQTHGKGARGRGGKSATTAASADAGVPTDATATKETGAAPSPASSAAGPSDAGSPPPSTTSSWPQVYDGGARLSPLTPAPEEHPVVAPAPTPADYDKTIAEIALLRARVAAVSDTLFRSRLALSVQLDSDNQRLSRMVVALDDGPVWEAPAGFRADEPIAVYDHAVAPGRHAISVHIERKDARDGSFTSEQTSRVIVEVPKDQRLDTTLKLEEDSSMGGKFSNDRKGDYDLRVRVKASAQPVGR